MVNRVLLMKIKQISQLLYWVLLVFIVGISIMWSLFFVSIDNFGRVLHKNAPFIIQWQTVETWQLYLSACLLFVPVAIFLWGVHNLRKLFRAFNKGEYFDIQNVSKVKNFSLSLVASAVLQTILISIVSVIMSINHPEGQQQLSLSITSQMVFIIVLGLIFYAMSKILLEAHAIYEENKEFV